MLDTACLHTDGMTDSDMRAIAARARLLVHSGIIEKCLLRDLGVFGRLAAFIDPEGEVICQITKQSGLFAVYGPEGRVIFRDRRLDCVLALLDGGAGEPCHESANATAPLSGSVDDQVRADQAMAMAQGGRPGRGFDAHG